MRRWHGFRMFALIGTHALVIRGPVKRVWALDPLRGRSLRQHRTPLPYHPWPSWFGHGPQAYHHSTWMTSTSLIAGGFEAMRTGEIPSFHRHRSTTVDTNTAHPRRCSLELKWVCRLLSIRTENHIKTCSTCVTLML